MVAAAYAIHGDHAFVTYNPYETDEDVRRFHHHAAQLTTALWSRAGGPAHSTLLTITKRPGGAWAGDPSTDICCEAFFRYISNIRCAYSPNSNSSATTTPVYHAPPPDSTHSDVGAKFEAICPSG